MRRTDMVLKAAVNDAQRNGPDMTGKPATPPPFEITQFLSGPAPGIDPDKMNQLLDDLEVEDYLAKQAK